MTCTIYKRIPSYSYIPNTKSYHAKVQMHSKTFAWYVKNHNLPKRLFRCRLCSSRIISFSQYSKWKPPTGWRKNTSQAFLVIFSVKKNSCQCFGHKLIKYIYIHYIHEHYYLGTRSSIWLEKTVLGINVQQQVFAILSKLKDDGWKYISRLYFIRKLQSITNIIWKVYYTLSLILTNHVILSPLPWCSQIICYLCLQPSLL